MLPSTPCTVPGSSSHQSAILIRQIKSEPESSVDLNFNPSLEEESSTKFPQTHSAPLIDISTPESLERDFHAWLKGELKSSTKRSFFCSDSEPISMFLSPLMKTEQCSIEQMDLAILFGERRVSLPPVHFKEECFPLLSAGQSPSSSSHSSEGSPLTRNNNGKKERGERIVLTEIGAINSDGGGGGKASAAAGGNMDPARSQNLDDMPGSKSSGVNQLGRTYSPGLPLSMSERQQIVELHQMGWKICDISKYLCVTHSCVSKILQRFRTTGSVRPKDAKEGRQESPLVAAIRNYRLRLGIVRQSEIREQLIRDGLCRRENAPSRSSINHILRTKLNLVEQQQKKAENYEN